MIRDVQSGVTCTELFFKIKKKFIGVQLIYNAVLLSDVWQSESVIHIHIFTFFFDSLPIMDITEYWVEFPVLYCSFLLVIYFVYSNVYMSTSASKFILSPPLPPGNHKFVFCICNSVSLFLKYLFVWLCRIFVAAQRIFDSHCSIWDL